jgi:hypothetical protein
MLVRYNGTWYKITPKPNEPERVTEEVAWLKIKGEGGYPEWFKRERNLSKILYNERPG